MILSTDDGDAGVGWEVVEETLKCMQLGLMRDAQTEVDGRDARSNASEVCLCIIMLCDYVLAFLCSGKCGDVASECLCVSVFLCMRPSMNQLVFPFYARVLHYTGYIHAGTHDMTQDVYVRSKFMYVLRVLESRSVLSVSHKHAYANLI